MRAALARTDADGAPSLPPGARAAEFEPVAEAAVSHNVHSLVGVLSHTLLVPSRASLRSSLCATVCRQGHILGHCQPHKLVQHRTVWQLFWTGLAALLRHALHAVYLPLITFAL